MFSSFQTFYSKLVAFGNSLQPLFLLCVRLFWGWQFFDGGLNKLLDIAPVADYFQSLNLSYPLANAYMVGAVECIGGACLLLGLASRLVAIPLIVTMLTAIFLPHPMSLAEIVADPLQVVKSLPFTFFLASLIIFVFGPGAISLDALFKRYAYSGKQK